MIEFDKDELEELRDCELIQKLNKRHRKIVEWTIREYLEIEAKSNEKIPVEIHAVKNSKFEPIDFTKPQNYLVVRRKLENLNATDFDFGLYFYMNNYMPFFTDQDVGLFKTIKTTDDEDEVETGDMCLVKMKYVESYWLAFKEENSFFALDGDFLGDDKDIEIVGVLVNIETR